MNQLFFFGQFMKPEMMDERLRRIAAREARSVGINWTFALMVDIARDPRWGRIVEDAGEDPSLSAKMAAQVAVFRAIKSVHMNTFWRVSNILPVTAWRTAGAITTLRIFPNRRCSNVYLLPFKAVVEANVGSVMSAYMDLNDVPATGNKWLMRDVLREGLEFQRLCRQRCRRGEKCDDARFRPRPGRRGGEGYERRNPHSKLFDSNKIEANIPHDVLSSEKITTEYLAAIVCSTRFPLSQSLVVSAVGFSFFKLIDVFVISSIAPAIVTFLKAVLLNGSTIKSLYICFRKIL